MKYRNLLFLIGVFFILTLVVASCSKEAVTNNPPLPGKAASASFVEEFDSVETLTAKGWAFRNNSFPIGQSGWRKGRYEASQGQGQVPFKLNVAYYGFPAYSAHNAPNDFISCDVTAGNDVNGTADISAWLISPQLPMRNGDSVIFYTRAINDANYSIYLKDRMQVRANYTDGTTNVGNGTTSTGSFSVILRDINQTYSENDPTGYPELWTKISIRLAGIPGDSIRNGRFAFRYMSTDAGIYGGNSGANFPGVVGLDSLAFIHK